MEKGNVSYIELKKNTTFISPSFNVASNKFSIFNCIFGSCEFSAEQKHYSLLESRTWPGHMAPTAFAE